jgi:RNA polymerase sigma factor for flagellar operon FliA
VGVVVREELTQRYTPFVRSIAVKVKKIIGEAVELEDLIEYGMIGLFEAADRFKPDKGVHFTTFAYYRIRGAIYDGVRGMGWLSRKSYTQFRFAEHANTLLQHSAESLNSELQSTPMVKNLQKVTKQLATSYLINLDAAHFFYPTQDSQEESFISAEMQALLQKNIQQLSSREQDFLKMYYYEDMTLVQIGRRLGVSRSWSSRLHSRIIEKLSRIIQQNI